MYPRQAKANHFGPGIEVDFVTTHNETSNTIAVLGDSPQGTGVKGQGGNYGVRGVGSKTGVWGSASEAGFEGVFGEHTGTSGYGVVGFGKGSSGAGVLGRNSDGPGVQGENTDFGTGVVGKGEVGVSGEGFIGVRGANDGDSGYGVTGTGSDAGVRGGEVGLHRHYEEPQILDLVLKIGEVDFELRLRDVTLGVKAGVAVLLGCLLAQPPR